MAPTRVLLLAGSLQKKGGIGRYTRELARALSHHPDVALTLAIERGATDQWGDPGLAAGTEWAELPGRTQITHALGEQYGLGRTIRRHRIDVVHGTKHVIPHGSVPTVLTVHDLMLLTSADQFPFPKRQLLPRQFLGSLTRATVLLSTSAAGTERLARYRADLGAKTVLARLGVSTELTEAEALAPPSAPTTPFALVVGDLSPRKNIPFLVDLWPKVHAEVGLHLVVVGLEGWHHDEVRQRLDAAREAGMATWAEDVSDGQLKWFYQHATVVLAPSKEEGYGLPALEARAFDAPLITSTDPSLVEVAGPRWPHLDPSDRAAWIDAITAAALAADRVEPPDDTALPTWADCAEATVGAYRMALARSGR